MLIYKSANYLKIANVYSREVDVMSHSEKEKSGMGIDRVYSRQQMISMLREASPEYSNGSYQWKLGEMLRSGEIVRTGYDQYMIISEPLGWTEYSICSDRKRYDSLRFPLFAGGRLSKCHAKAGKKGFRFILGKGYDHCN